MLAEMYCAIKAYAKRHKSLSESDKVNLVNYGEYLARIVSYIDREPYKKIYKDKTEKFIIELELLYEVNSSIVSRKRLHKMIRLLEAKPPEWRWVFIKTWLDDKVDIIKYMNKKGI